MPRATVLVIDDDPTLLALIRNHLGMAGYRALLAAEGPIGLEMMQQSPPDLVILDVMMPGMDGWEVCQKLREHSPVPVILLTAKGAEIDKLRGFQLGVDDYVTKPFSFAELVARVGAVLARSQHGTNPVHHVVRDDLVIDLDHRRVTLAGQEIELTPTEYRLLELLARHAGRPVATETLLSDVWGPAYLGEPDHVKRYIWTLRKKIEADPGDPQHILTERGFGYRFE